MQNNEKDSAHKKKQEDLKIRLHPTNNFCITKIGKKERCFMNTNELKIEEAELIIIINIQKEINNLLQEAKKHIRDKVIKKEELLDRYKTMPKMVNKEIVVEFIYLELSDLQYIINQGIKFINNNKYNDAKPNILFTDNSIDDYNRLIKLSQEMLDWLIGKEKIDRKTAMELIKKLT